MIDVIEGDSIFAVLVDYDNLLETQKRAGIIDVVTKALIQLPLESPIRAKCEVRIYGGWYEGDQMTRKAQDVAIEIQRDFPRVIRLRRDKYSVFNMPVNAELAVALLQEPSHHLFNTYRRKGKPANVRVEEPTLIGCNDSSCILPLMKKLLKSGRCPKDGCLVTDRRLVYRQEQKIVDTMLACDLIYAANAGYSQIILISGDDDFLPPLRTILLNGASVARFHPNPSRQGALYPQWGVRLIELGL